MSDTTSLVVGAGRELDAQIAEKVMKWNVRWAKPVTVGSRILDCDSTEPKVGLMPVKFVRDGEPVMEIPRYSTDIAAAFLVVEEMKRKGFLFHLTDYPERGVSAVFYPTDPAKYNPFMPWSQAKATPHAICLAALQTVSEETKS